jgi:hypothetical protein
MLSASETDDSPVGLQCCGESPALLGSFCRTSLCMRPVFFLRAACSCACLVPEPAHEEKCAVADPSMSTV